MKKNKLILAVFCTVLLGGCEGILSDWPFAENTETYKLRPMCHKAEPLYVDYGYNNSITVPTCQLNSTALVNTEADLRDLDFDIDTNFDYVEGDFPDVENNKHLDNQVVMQNLESRVLAFCRGSQQAVDTCVERLSCIGYVRVSNVPKVPAKYDLAPNKGYPARRWREGEVVPRW